MPFEVTDAETEYWVLLYVFFFLLAVLLAGTAPTPLSLYGSSRQPDEAVVFVSLSFIWESSDSAPFKLLLLLVRE